MIYFTNAAKPWKEKAKQIVDYLSRHKGITDYLGDRPCPITLNTDENPAAVIDRGNRVQIDLAGWYFETYSLGYVLGMLCHEFAVHPMATAEGFHEFEEDMLTEPLETGLEGLTVTAQAAKQQDHIFASVRGMPRFRIYRNVVMEMAALLAEEDMRQFFATDRGGSGAADLIDCYLMDVASILGTNDHRKQGFSKAGSIAALYNLLRDELLAEMRDNPRYSAVPKHVRREDKSTFDVFSDYTTVGRRLLAGKLCTSCILSQEEVARKAQKKARKLEAQVRPIIGNVEVFDSIKNDDL